MNCKTVCQYLLSAAATTVVLLSGLLGAVSVSMAQTPSGQSQHSNVKADKAGQLENLSFDELWQKALADNPGIDIAQARIDKATEFSNQNRSYRFPKIEVTAAIGPEHNDPAPSSDTGHALTAGRNLKLNLTKHLYDGGSSRSEYYRSQRLESAAQAEARIVIEDLYRDLTRFYIDYWRYSIDLSQADVFVATMQQLVDKLDIMYRSGGASKLEADFARARLASARGASSSATATLNNAFSELEYLVQGLVPFRPASPQTFSELKLLSLNEYVEQGATANSGFVTNHLNTEATSLRVLAQKGRFKPSFDFELSASLIDEEGGPSPLRGKAAAKILLSYTLYSGGERRGGVRRAEAQVRELQAERVQLERDVFRAIDQSYNSITAARLTLDALLDEISANEELQRLNRKNLALGTINIIELIDVEERLFNARSRKNEVIATMFQEYIDLMISAGFTERLLDASVPIISTE